MNLWSAAATELAFCLKERLFRLEQPYLVPWIVLKVRIQRLGDNNGLRFACSCCFNSRLWILKHSCLSLSVFENPGILRTFLFLCLVVALSYKRGLLVVLVGYLVFDQYFNIHVGLQFNQTKCLRVVCWNKIHSHAWCRKCISSCSCRLWLVSSFGCIVFYTMTSYSCVSITVN